MKKLFTTLAAAAVSLSLCACGQTEKKADQQTAPQETATFNNAMGTFPGEENMNYATDILTGAQQVEEYLKLVEGKRVCVLSNQSGMASATAHVLDTLLAHNVNVTCIMSPEHGFRGDADAGEHAQHGQADGDWASIISRFPASTYIDGYVVFPRHSKTSMNTASSENEDDENSEEGASGAKIASISALVILGISCTKSTTPMTPKI